MMQVTNKFIKSMKVKLLFTGKTEEGYIRQGIEIFKKRLGHYLPFEIIEIPKIRNIKKITAEQQIKKEGELIMKNIKEGEEVFLLDKEGKQYSSEELAGFLHKKTLEGIKTLVFVTGGAYGFSADIYKKYNKKISLSKMTFTHEMVRLIFVEQLYRAMTIIRGESYHH